MRVLLIAATLTFSVGCAAEYTVEITNDMDPAVVPDFVMTDILFCSIQVGGEPGFELARNESIRVSGCSEGFYPVFFRGEIGGTLVKASPAGSPDGWLIIDSEVENGFISVVISERIDVDFCRETTRVESETPLFECDYLTTATGDDTN